MKKYWRRTKAWTKRTWSRLTRWVLGILASLGLITAALVAPVEVSYTPANKYEDGTALPIAEIAETRLYCNGLLIATEPGADGVFDDVSTLLPTGESDCYGTHVATNSKESGPSNIVTVTVLSGSAPNPPELIP